MRFIHRNAIGLATVTTIGAWLVAGRCTVRQELNEVDRAQLLSQLHISCSSQPCAVVLGLKDSPEFEATAVQLQRSGVETHAIDCTGSEPCWNTITELGRGFGGAGTPVLINFPTVLLGNKIYRDISKLSTS
jgi:hypothetical protein